MTDPDLKASMSNEFIKLPCPQCDKRLKLSAQKKRRKIVCPKCGHVFALEGELEKAASARDEDDSNEFLNPSEVASMQVEPEDMDQDQPVIPNAGLPLSSSSGQRDAVDEETVDTAMCVNEAASGEIQEKAQQWLEQQKRAAELSQKRYRRFGYCLILLALAAIAVQFLGYRFEFLDGMVFRIAGGFGVFYFILLGILGTYLVAYLLRNSVPKANWFALSASLLLVAAGIGSFMTARGADAKHRDEMAAIKANAAQPIPDHRSTVVIQRNQPGGRMVKKEKVQVTEPNARKNVARRGFGAIGNPTPSVLVPLEPIQSDGKNADEAFRPQEQKTNFSVDRIIKETNENPFKSMNAAEFGLAADLGADGQDRDFDIPRPDTVRDLVSYPAKREAMLQRKAALRPVLVDGKKIMDASRFEEFQLTKIAGKQTKLGRIYFGQQPCRGLDTLKTSTASQASFKLILPIHDQPEFSNSLCYKKGFYLAGIKVNLQDQEVVGIQAILAPGQGAQLDMENLVTSAWAGQETAAQPFRVDAPLGNAVYGIVVYEAKNKITGIGLVQKK